MKMHKRIIDKILQLLIKHGGLLSFCMIVSIIYSHCAKLSFGIGMLLGFPAYFLLNLMIEGIHNLSEDVKIIPNNRVNESPPQTPAIPKTTKIKSMEQQMQEPDHVDEDYLNDFLNNRCKPDINTNNTLSNGMVDISASLNDDAMNLDLMDDKSNQMLFDNLSI